MTNGEIAAIIGVHVKYVPTLRKKPGFPAAGSLEDIAKWYATYRQSGETADNTERRGRLLDEQVAFIAAKTQRELLRLQQEEGLVVKEGAAKEAITAVFRPLRLKLDALPTRKSHELNPSDPVRAETVLREALQELYTELQADWPAMLPNAPAS